VLDGLRAHILETRATAIVIGKSRRSWWFELRHGSVVDQLVRELDNVAVHVVPIKLAPAPEGETAMRRRSATRGSAAGLGMVAATTAGAVAVQPVIGSHSVDLLYLLPVIATATLFGLRPSLIASLAAALAYNFFFLPPLHSFTINDPQNVVTLSVLIIVAVVASQLTGRLQREATIGARTASENAALAAFGQRLASVSDEAGTAAAVCEEVAQLLNLSTVLFARDDSMIVPIGASPPNPTLGALDMAAAEWSFDRGEITGRDSGTLTSSEWQFHPLETALGVLGVLGIAPDGSGDPVPADKRILFTTLLGQAALAHERLKLEANAREVGALKQRDDLRATLLSSMGHDLKTPLTAVVAAADALAAEHGESATTATLKGEARRLRRVFDDLVEMTRIEAGALVVKREATDLTDAIAAAAHDLRAELVRHKLILDAPPNLPLVEADPRMLHHILINLLGNAAKFSNPGSPITVQARRLPDQLVLMVLDEGPGIPIGRETSLFDRFIRVDGDDRSGGAGLGLAIVKGFADAMGLAVTASNRDPIGAAFSIAWPEASIRRITE
jgi:two-component system sensor histidine kinase KdpD